jgi:hypothetical protein
MCVEAFLRGLSADFLQTVFQEGIRRLQLCCESAGEYVEWRLQDGIFTFVMARIGDESPGQYRTLCMVGMDQIRSSVSFEFRRPSAGSSRLLQFDPQRIWLPLCLLPCQLLTICEPPDAAFPGMTTRQ